MGLLRNNDVCALAHAPGASACRGIASVTAFCVLLGCLAAIHHGLISVAFYFGVPRCPWLVRLLSQTCHQQAPLVSPLTSNMPPIQGRSMRAITMMERGHPCGMPHVFCVSPPTPANDRVVHKHNLHELYVLIILGRQPALRSSMY